jgi:4-hydroxybenzoate polyprenyltransferase
MAPDTRTLYVRLDDGLLPGTLVWEERLARLKGGAVAVDLLPYDEAVVAQARAARAAGRDVVLIAESHAGSAGQVAAHLGCFTGVVRAGGDAAAAAKKHADGRDHEVAPARRAGRPWGAAAQSLRPHQWVKNTLVFLPLLMAHRLGEPSLWLHALAAFTALSLAASGVYAANDLLDLEADRRHPTKRRRPLASGALPIPAGIALTVLLFALAAALAAAWLPPAFGAVLAFYAVTSTAYSVRLKRVMALDVVVLAGLYALRLVAGGIVTGVPLSTWLLAFSMFFFLSLAVLKRTTELDRMREAGGDAAGLRRGYREGDIAILRSVGPASGYLSVLVLVLYISSDAVAPLYRHPEVLWLISPLLLYWVTRIWILGNRRQVDDDPIVFTVRDRVSWLAGLLVVLVLVAASL